jgi:hypothetical protein
VTPFGRILLSTMLVFAFVALVAGTASATDGGGSPPATITLQGETSSRRLPG